MSTAVGDWISDQERAELVGASDALREAVGVAVPVPQLEALEKAERKRLRDLVARLQSTPQGPPVPSPDQRAAADAFADGVERLPTPSKALEREQRLLAAYTREIGFLPTAAERLVFRGVPADATLEGLRADLARVAPESRGRWNWAAFPEGEAAQLEALVEKALDQPGLFAERRGESGSRLRVGMLMRRAEDGSPRRALLPEGCVPLPAEVLHDVHRGQLQPVDVAVLAVYALSLQSRQIDPARERYARFDGDTLVVGDGGRALLRDWDPGARDMYARVISASVTASLERLRGRRWLQVEADGKAARIRAGERLTGAGRGG